MELTTNQIFLLNGVTLPRPGVYEFVISTNEQEMGRVPLRVIAMTPPSS